MNKLLLLSQNDFRLTYREPILRSFLFFPLLAFAIVRFIVPMLMDRFPVLGPHGPVIAMWAGLQAGTMFGFCTDF
ncbi:MAG: hypothetical protein HC880_17885 [Bacteroidia bacterium]|nr:hypothetical protein [Bacteroidia bacterium]